MVADRGGRSAILVWCGYAAFTLGLLYAVVSAYWAAGGTVGLDTLGGKLEESARERDAQVVTLVWLTAALKLLAALLGLAVTLPRGRRAPRWLLLAVAWSTAAVLTLYGGALVIAQALVEARVIKPAEDIDWRAFHWHLFLWDPWFLVWGLLLGAATLGYARRR